MGHVLAKEDQLLVRASFLKMEMTIGLKMLSYFAPSAIRTSTTLLITKTVTMNCQLSVEYLTAQQQSGRILDDYRRL